MKTEGGPYTGLIEDFLYHKRESGRMSEAEEEELDALLVTVRREMQSRGTDDQSAHSRELEEAIARIFELLAPRIYRYALSELTKLGRNLGLEAEDVAYLVYGQLNKFLLKILPRSKFEYKGPKGTISYLRKSTKNIILDLWRRACTHPEVSFDALQENGFDQGAEDESINQVERPKLPFAEAMDRAKLTEREKAVVKMTFEEDMKPRDIARRIDENPERVSRILDRAKIKLRKVIKRDQDGDWELL
ncbi:MAG TPA: sigma-70 family RNA polymerase sigma factor [Chloroflexia bacterium]|nr:sigma-70 family RNA polymerase sigma factor [Chloroflexia bacterium]